MAYMRRSDASCRGDWLQASGEDTLQLNENASVESNCVISSAGADT